MISRSVLLRCVYVRSMVLSFVWVFVVPWGCIMVTGLLHFKWNSATSETRATGFPNFGNTCDGFSELRKRKRRVFRTPAGGGYDARVPAPDAETKCAIHSDVIRIRASSSRYRPLPGIRVKLSSVGGYELAGYNGYDAKRPWSAQGNEERTDLAPSPHDTATPPCPKAEALVVPPAASALQGGFAALILVHPTSLA